MMRLFLLIIVYKHTSIAMLLIADQLFYNALSTDADIIELTEGRIYNTCRNEEDEEEDKLPYIIITYDGMTNDEQSKDDVLESDMDRETVSVLVVAENREALADLMGYVRPCIKLEIEGQTNGEDVGFIIDDYHLSASGVECDPSRPCHYQTLRYECETYNV